MTSLAKGHSWYVAEQNPALGAHVRSRVVGSGVQDLSQGLWLWHPAGPAYARSQLPRLEQLQALPLLLRDATQGTSPPPHLPGSCVYLGARKSLCFWKLTLDGSCCCPPDSVTVVTPSLLRGAQEDTGKQSFRPSVLGSIWRAPGAGKLSTRSDSRRGSGSPTWGRGRRDHTRPQSCIHASPGPAPAALCGHFPEPQALS